MLAQAVESYLKVRRACGVELKSQGNLLRSFAVFSDAKGKHHVCSDVVIDWAGLGSVHQRARRLGDPEAPGQFVLDPVELDQDIDILRRANLGHLRNIPKSRPVEIVIPGHVDHDRPFCLVACVRLCFLHRLIPPLPNFIKDLF